MTARYSQDGKRVCGTWLIVPKMSVVGPRLANSKTLLKLQKTPRISKLKEIPATEQLEPNSEIKIEDIIKVGDWVNVTNTTKGRGFAGGVRRWGFAGGPRTHGQSDRERAPGSSGGGTRMGKLYKGRHAPGKMGNQNVMIRNLQVLEIDLAKSKVLVSGLIPGSGLTLSQIQVIR